MDGIPKEPMPLVVVQNTPFHNGWKKFTINSQTTQVQGEGMWLCSNNLPIVTECNGTLESQCILEQ
jgi:hypothetical protein